MTTHIDRRLFLKLGGASLASSSFWAPSIGQAMPAAAADSGKVLVGLFMRGGVDALSVIVPYGDDEYYRDRSSIAIAAPGKERDGAVRLDERFALHPSLRVLEPWFKSGRLAAVHAVGSPHPTRSHFDAQDHMESGTPGRIARRDGWANRCLRQTPGTDMPLRAVALGATLPLALAGEHPSLALSGVDGFRLPGGKAARDRLEEGFEALHHGRDDPFARAGDQALRSLRLIRENVASNYQPEHGADYPRSARSLRDAAQLIKARLGTQVMWIDVGGWDTHAGQGGARGQLASRLQHLGQGLAAFATDLGSRMSDVLLLTMSEFGRTVAQNGTGGTDHGHGTAMFVLGGKVKGGRVYGRWPGLARQQRYQERDLAVTTDFRDLFGEVAERHLKAKDRRALFPEHQPGPELGLL